MSDDRVWIARSSYRRYHTERGCPRIKGEATDRPRAEIEADDRFEICAFCDGLPTASGGYGQLAADLEALGPEDLGLSPIGERRVQR